MGKESKGSNPSYISAVNTQFTHYDQVKAWPLSVSKICTDVDGEKRPEL